MSTNPPSFRLPFVLPDGDEDAKVHPAVAQAIRYCFNGLLDLNQAIPKIKSQVTTVTNSVNTLAAGGSSGGSNPASSGHTSIGGTAGGVNEQSANYSLQSGDFGSLIVMSGAVLTLNNAVGTPFYAVVQNAGAGDLALSPTAGLVSLSELIPDQSALVFFDGVNWWVTTLPDYLLGGASGEGAVVLDSGATLISPMIIGCDSGSTFISPILYGASIVGLPVFANNGAAISGGLVTGNLYQSGGNPSILCVVD